MEVEVEEGTKGDLKEFCLRLLEGPARRDEGRGERVERIERIERIERR